MDSTSDPGKSKDELLAELATLRHRYAELAALETEHTRTLEVLQNTEGRFRDLVEGSIQGILVHRNFTPLFVNQAYAAIFGYDTPDELLQATNIVEAVAAPHERARLMDYAQRQTRGEAAPPSTNIKGSGKMAPRSGWKTWCA